MRKVKVLRYATAVSLAVGVAALAVPRVEAADFVIRFTHGMPEVMDSDQHAYAVIFKEKIEAESRGRVEVRVLGANKGGNERQQLERVQAGINQMANVSEGTQHLFFKPGLVLSIPFLFSSSAVAWEVMDGPFGQKYNEAFLKETGVRILNHTESGFRSMFNSVRPIRSPADLAGLKIRTMENPVHMQMMRGLGANPTPIAWTDVYTALQQRVVDGMENPPGLALLMKFNEQQKYLTLDRHLYSVHTTMINEKLFQSLPDDIKNLVVLAAREALTVSRAAAYREEGQAVQNLRKQGIEVYFPTPEEYQQFRKQGRPPAEAYVRKEVGNEWVDALFAAIDAAEKKLAYARR